MRPPNSSRQTLPLLGIHILPHFGSVCTLHSGPGVNKKHCTKPVLYPDVKYAECAALPTPSAFDAANQHAWQQPLQPLKSAARAPSVPRTLADAPSLKSSNERR